MPSFYENIQFSMPTIAWVYRFSDYSLRFYQTHWHRDVEMIYVLNGSCRTALNGREIILQAGDLFLANSGDMHYVQLHTSEPCDAIVVTFPYRLLTQICDSFSGMSFVPDPQEEHYPELISAFRDLVPLTGKGERGKYDFLTVNSILYRILSILLRYYCVPAKITLSFESASTRQFSLCHNILEYLEDNFRNDITLSTASREMNISKEYISRMLKDNLGITFKQYLTELRLSHAHKALLDSNQSVLAIAVESGFPNCKSFITAFHQRYSATPQKYRNMYRNAVETDNVDWFAGIPKTGPSATKSDKKDF